MQKYKTRVPVVNRSGQFEFSSASSFKDESENEDESSVSSQESPLGKAMAKRVRLGNVEVESERMEIA